ncbi:hypothetical protein LAD67_11600 [Escherichia coli]|nr:hypothetical protein [Escherichia coli]
MKNNVSAAVPRDGLAFSASGRSVLLTGPMTDKDEHFTGAMDDYHLTAFHTCRLLRYLAHD